MRSIHLNVSGCTTTDRVSVSPKVSAMSNGSDVRGAHGTVILNDLRTNGVIVVVPDTGGGKWGKAGGSGLTRRESQVVGAYSSCYSDPCKIHGREEEGKARLRVAARHSRKACMGKKRAKQPSQVRVRTTTSRPHQSVPLLLNPQRKLERGCGARRG